VVDTIPLPPGVFFSYAPTFVPSDGDLYLLAAGGIFVVNGSANSYLGKIPGPFTGGIPIGGPLVYDAANQELYEIWENLTIGPEYLDTYLAAFSTITQRLVSETLLSNGSTGGPGLGGVAVDPANGNLYVPLSGEPGFVAVVSGGSNTLVAELTVGNLPQTPALDSRTGDLYVSNLGSQNISVISEATPSVESSIALGFASPSTGISRSTIDPADGTLFVTSVFSRGTGSMPINYVQTLSLASQTVIANQTVGLDAGAPFLDPSLNEFVVEDLHNLTVFNASTGDLIATIPTEPLLGPANYFALNPAPQLAYATCPNPIGLAVISLLTDRAVANITVSTNPNTVVSGPVFDSDNGEVYLPVGSGTGNELLVIGASGPPTSSGAPAFGVPFLVGLGVGVVVVLTAAVVLVRSRLRRGGR